MAEPSTTSLNMLKHEAIKGILANAITTGKYKAGDRLPSIRELVERHSVSVTPVFRAISELTSDGLVRRIPGRRGLFVANPKEAGQVKQKLDAVVMAFESARYQHDGGASKIISQFLVESFMDSARQQGIDVRAHPHKPVVSDSEDTGLLEVLSRFKVVIFTDGTHIHWTKYLEAQGSHVLFMGTQNVFRGVRRIRPDVYAGVYGLVEHLVQLGHRHILFLDDINRIEGVTNKHLAYAHAMARHKLEPAVHWLEAGYQFEAYLAVRDVIPTWTPERRPTAILACNDLVALGAISALTQSGLRVPQDISVAGMDNRPESTHCDPPLTTSAFEYQAITNMALEWVHLAMTKPSPPALDAVVPHKLIVRQSTAAPSRL